jgi:hypothetical protein
MISSSEFPGKGTFPLSIMYRTTPSDQMSILEL